MATAIDVLNNASEMAKVKGVGQTLTGDYEQRYLGILNDMLDSWSGSGVDLGLPTLSLATTVFVHKADVLAIKYNLAVLIGEREGRDTPVNIQQRAVRLFGAMQSRYNTITPLETPTIFMEGYRTSNIENG